MFSLQFLYIDHQPPQVKVPLTELYLGQFAALLEGAAGGVDVQGVIHLVEAARRLVFPAACVG